MSGDGNNAPAPAGLAAGVSEAASITTARAMEHANQEVSSSAGVVLTREGRYYERLLRGMLAKAFIEGAMVGAELATRRAVATYAAPELELEVASSADVKQAELADPAAPEFVSDGKTWPGDDDP